MNYFHVYVLLAVGWITLLALNISATRIRFRIGLGDGNNLTLKKALRAHINTLEHCLPYGFVIFVLQEMNTTTSTMQLLVYGFMAARLGHAVSLFTSNGNLRRGSATIFYGFEFAGLVLIARGLL